MEYGPGYWQARQDIVDRKIADPNELRTGRPRRSTLAGEGNLRKTMDEVTKKRHDPFCRGDGRQHVEIREGHAARFDQDDADPGVRPLEDPKAG